MLPFALAGGFQPLDQQKSPDLSVLKFVRVCLFFRCTGSCTTRAFLAVKSRGYTLAAVLGPLTWGLLLWLLCLGLSRLQQLRFPASSPIVWAYRLSCSMHGTFQIRDKPPMPPGIEQGGFFTTESQRKSLIDVWAVVSKC